MGHIDFFSILFGAMRKCQQDYADAAFTVIYQTQEA
jgi:hypothetical protein